MGVDGGVFPKDPLGLTRGSFGFSLQSTATELLPPIFEYSTTWIFVPQPRHSHDRVKVFECPGPFVADDIDTEWLQQ